MSSQRTFLYTTGPGTNEVFAFEVHTNGSITPLGTPNFSAGSGPSSLAIHPPGDFVYIADTAGNTVTLLQINTGNGELTVPPTNSALPPITPPNIFNTGAAPVALVVAPNAPHVYVLNQADGNISAFLLDPSNGNLALITNPPVPAPNTTPSLTYGSFTAPSSLAISPQGDFLFVASPTQNAIFAFAVNSDDGSLAEVAGSPFATGVNTAPTTLAVHPSGNFLYATDTANNTVLAFSVQNGALSPVAGSPFAAGTQPAGIATDPGGAELFVANSGSNDISAYVIDASSGAIAPVAGSPFATGGRGPNFVATTGAFVYVGDQTTNDLAAFSIGRGGDLSPVPGSPFSVATSPSSIAMTVE